MEGAPGYAVGRPVGVCCPFLCLVWVWHPGVGNSDVSSTDTVGYRPFGGPGPHGHQGVALSAAAAPWEPENSLICIRQDPQARDPIR